MEWTRMLRATGVISSATGPANWVTGELSTLEKLSEPKVTILCFNLKELAEHHTLEVETVGLSFDHLSVSFCAARLCFISVFRQLAL